MGSSFPQISRVSAKDRGHRVRPERRDALASGQLAVRAVSRRRSSPRKKITERRTLCDGIRPGEHYLCGCRHASGGDLGCLPPHVRHTEETASAVSSFGWLRFGGRKPGPRCGLLGVMRRTYFLLLVGSLGPSLGVGASGCYEGRAEPEDSAANETGEPGDGDGDGDPGDGDGDPGDGDGEPGDGDGEPGDGDGEPGDGDGEPGDGDGDSEIAMVCDRWNQDRANLAEGNWSGS